MMKDFLTLVAKEAEDNSVISETTVNKPHTTRIDAFHSKVGPAFLVSQYHPC